MMRAAQCLSARFTRANVRVFDLADIGEHQVCRARFTNSDLKVSPIQLFGASDSGFSVSQKRKMQANQRAPIRL